MQFDPMISRILTLLLSLAILASCQKGVADVKVAPPADTTVITVVKPPVPLPVQNLSNISYGTDAMEKMDIYLPAGRTADSTLVMVFIHGGGWSGGDKAEFADFVTTFQKRFPTYAFANINYRLATVSENHFPAQENDVKTALNFLIQQSGEYHISQKMILLGASAGGHLALLQAYKNFTPKIVSVVDFYGPADMPALYNEKAGTSAQLDIQTLMNGTPSTNPSLYQSSSPLNYVNIMCPPTIILHGTLDDVVSIQESIALKNKLQTNNVEVQMVTYPNEGHGWSGADLDDSFNKIEVFLKAHAK